MKAEEDRLITYLTIWEATHRTLIYGLGALSLWIAAYLIYLKSDIKRYLQRRKAHKWGVDMETKSVTAGPKSVR